MTGRERLGRCRGDRGLASLPELAVAAGISALVALMVSVYVVAANEATAGVTNQAIANQSASEVLQEYARTLRSSRPVGACTKDPVGAPLASRTPLGTCLAEGYQVREEGGSVEVRTIDGNEALCGFLDPPGSGGTTALDVPSLVCAGFDPGEETLTVQVYPPTGSATYTTPDWAATATDSRLIGTLDTPSGIFTLIQADGTERPFPGSVADAQTVAVRLSPTIVYFDGDRSETISYNLNVALRGGRYLRDAYWTGDSYLDDGGP